MALSRTTDPYTNESDSDEELPDITPPRHRPVRESWIGCPSSTTNFQTNEAQSTASLPKFCFLSGGLIEVFAPFPPGMNAQEYLSDRDSPETVISEEPNHPMDVTPSTSAQTPNLQPSTSRHSPATNAVHEGLNTTSHSESDSDSDDLPFVNIYPIYYMRPGFDSRHGLKWESW